ncbi:hypothetical protein chiPu_0031415, partial [Chiloscyllium punctatum]|nr:hypothetical protein [Chiloscyllium punctatum]
LSLSLSPLSLSLSRPSLSLPLPSPRDRSWLLTEGYIDSPDELLLPSPGADSDGAVCLAAAGEREEVEGGLAADRPGESWPYRPETPALLLLSRFSQAEVPAPGLLTEQSVRVLLDYLTQAPAPSSRCSRLLGRLVCNPNCLEDLLRARAVPLLRAQLILGWRPPSPCTEGGTEDGAARGTQRDWAPARPNKEL